MLAAHQRRYVQTTQKAIWVILSTIMVAILAGCGGGAATPSPAEAKKQVVEQYFRAKIAGDRDKLRTLLCRSMEGDLDVEAMSFSGTNAQLKDMVCSATDNSDVVSCTGEILTTYGGEQSKFPLGKYRVVGENGEWKWCGEAP